MFIKISGLLISFGHGANFCMDRPKGMPVCTGGLRGKETIQNLVFPVSFFCFVFWTSKK